MYSNFDTVSSVLAEDQACHSVLEAVEAHRHHYCRNEATGCDVMLRQSARLLVLLSWVVLLYVDWSIDRLTEWLTDWLTNWLTHWLTNCLTVWWIDWLIDWLIDWFLDDWRTDWLIDWLIDWLTGWLTDWLTDWPTDWMTDLQTYSFSHSFILACFLVHGSLNSFELVNWWVGWLGSFANFIIGVFI